MGASWAAGAGAFLGADTVAASGAATTGLDVGAPRLTPGIVTASPHPPHFARLPACSSAARNFFPQAQANSIGIVVSPEKRANAA
jgi:hypothetical protein